jgi:hypothetical protein
MMFCGIPGFVMDFVDKNTVTQGCNQGMRPNAAKCGYNSKIKSYISNRANYKRETLAPCSSNLLLFILQRGIEGEMHQVQCG